VAALGLTAVCLTLVVHAAVQGERFAASQRHRAEAFAACQGQMERLRAGGFSGLPAMGTHDFDSPAAVGELGSSPHAGEARGEIVVAAGPVAHSPVVIGR